MVKVLGICNFKGFSYMVAVPPKDDLKVSVPERRSFRDNLQSGSATPPKDQEKESGAPRSFADKLIAQKGHLIHKIQATDITGERAYYFLLVEPHREKALADIIASKQDFDLLDYGKIIASCYGEEPSEEVRTFLKDRYGFDV